MGPDKGNLKKVDNAICGILACDLGIKRHVLNRCATVSNFFGRCINSETPAKLSSNQDFYFDLLKPFLKSFVAGSGELNP